MERVVLSCQVCETTSTKVYPIKAHLESKEHQEKMEETFCKETFSGKGFFPKISVISPRHNRSSRPIVGFSMLTLCFSRASGHFFYLCHVCEENCPPYKVDKHLTSTEHYVNYFCYKNPNMLRFAWIPGMDWTVILKREISKEVENGKGILQLLNVPESVMRRLHNSTYAEVMHILSDYEKLLDKMKAFKSTRTTMQTYQRDGNRKHPLLGMQHIVECICAGPTEKKYYLCTLCNLTLASYMIIKHVLSFDHIYCYFKAWHPSTLVAKESYIDYKSFAYIVLNLARQTEEIHATANTDMKQMTLEPPQFKSVNFACYAEALKALESIRKENQESSLITSVIPGNKLEYPRTVSAVAKSAVSTAAASVTSTAAVVSKGSSASAASTQSAASTESAASTASASSTLSEASSTSAVSKGSSGPVVSTAASEPPAAAAALKPPAAPAASKPPVAPPASKLPPVPAALKPPAVPAASKTPAASKLPAALAALKPPAAPAASKTPAAPAASKPPTALAASKPPAALAALKLPSAPAASKTPTAPPASKPPAVPAASKPPAVPAASKPPATPAASKTPTAPAASKLPVAPPASKLPVAPPASKPATVPAASKPPAVPAASKPPAVPTASKPPAAPAASKQPAALTASKPPAAPAATKTAAAPAASKPLAASKSPAVPAAFKPPTASAASTPSAVLKLAAAKKVPPASASKPATVPTASKPSAQPAAFMLSAVSSTSFAASATSEVSTILTFKLRCQNCRTSFEDISDYNSHLSSEGHKKMLKMDFGGEDHNQQTGSKQFLSLNKYIHESKEPNQPPIGLSLVVACVSSQEEPFYMCFACRNCFSESLLSQHIDSQKHLIHMLLYQNPWRLPFGWVDGLNEEVLRLEAWEEEKARGHNLMMLKVLDIPYRLFQSLIPYSGDYPEVLKRLEDYHMILKNDVPQHETNTKLKQNEKFPILGLGFLVMHDVHISKEMGFLCSLCERRLSMDESPAHLFSWEHVAKFLNRFHPGSLEPSTNTETLMDLAKQASSLQPKLDIQVIKLKNPIWEPCSYAKAKAILTSVKKRDLAPKIMIKKRLVPRGILTDRDPRRVNKQTNGRMKDTCEGGEPSSETPDSAFLTQPTQKRKLSQDDACSHVNVKQGMDPKRLRLTSKEDTTCEKSRNSSCSRQKGECGTSDNETTKKKAIQALEALWDQLDSELASSGQPMDTSSTLHDQFEIVDMDVDDETQNSQAHTQVDENSHRCTAANPTLRAAAEAPASSLRAAPTSDTASTVQYEAACRAAPVPKIKNSSTTSKNASKPVAPSQTTVTKTSVKCDNMKTAHIKNSVGLAADGAPTFHKRKAAAAPHLTKHRDSPTEPSHDPSSKTKPGDSYPKVGRDQLILVECDTKRQIYCKLCSVRLQRSSHMTTFAHCFKYVKKCYPDWSANPLELGSKVFEMGTILEEAEKKRGVTNQLLEVDIDVYKELAAFPEDKAIKNVTAMLRQRDLHVSSPSTANIAKAWRKQVSYTSPCEASSPNDGMCIQKNEGLSPDTQSEEENKYGQWSPLVQIPEIESSSQEEGSCAVGQLKSPDTEDHALILDQLHSCPTVNRNDPVAHPGIQDAGIAVNTEQQKQPRPSKRAEHVSNDSQAPQMRSIGLGTAGCSNLTTYLKVKGYDGKPIIGRASVWECQGISLDTFYLCESCRETLPFSDIFKHLRSDSHWLNYITRVYPRFVYFWSYEDLLPWMKSDILEGIAEMLLPLERDVKFLLLRPELYNNVRKAPFKEALKMVRGFNSKESVDVPSCTPHQKGPGQNDEKHQLKDTVCDLDAFKDRRVSGPLDVNSVSPKAESVVSAFAGVDASLSPLEHPESRPSVPQCQRPPPELQVKQAEMDSEFLSTSIDYPKTSQPLPLSPSDECPPARVEQAVGSNETLLRSCTDIPQLEDPLPATCERTCSELSVSQPSPKVDLESTSADPAATPTPSSPMDKNTGPGSGEPDTSSMDWTNQLLALVRATKSARNLLPCQSAPDKTVMEGETTVSCDNNSSESGGVRWSPNSKQTTSDNKSTKWDSKWWPFKVEKNYSLAEIFSVAAPVVSGHDNQLVIPNDNSEGSTSKRGNLTLSATETRPAGTMLPSASPVDPTYPQQQTVCDAQSTLGNASVSDPSPIYSEVTNNSQGQIPQPQFNGQGYTEVDRDYQTPHSSSTAAVVNPSDASGGYSQYRTMAHVPNRQSGYFPSHSVGGYTTPKNPPVYTGSSYPWQGYTSSGFYPNQNFPTLEANPYYLQTAAHRVETPPVAEWVRLRMLQQQQLLTQQQLSSWKRPEDAQLANKSAYVVAIPFPPPASNSQAFVDLNQYSTKRIGPAQNSSMITQNPPQAYHNPMAMYCPPAADTEISSQIHGNSFFYSDTRM